MPILNYTTTVAASKSVAEIQSILAKAGAQQTVIRYGKDTQPTALVFELQGEMYMLPCRAEAVHKILKGQRIDARYRTVEHANRVAWRILKDWVEAQAAIIATGMVDAQEVMLPYMLLRDDQTVYDNFREQRADRLLEAKQRGGIA